MTTSGAFLAGKLVDESDLSPLTACYTIVTEGTLHGQSGFVKIRGDHQLAQDGTFSSPPLPPGKYFLRFSACVICLSQLPKRKVVRRSRVASLISSTQAQKPFRVHRRSNFTRVNL